MKRLTVNQKVKIIIGIIIAAIAISFYWAWTSPIVIQNLM